MNAEVGIACGWWPDACNTELGNYPSSLRSGRTHHRAPGGTDQLWVQTRWTGSQVTWSVAAPALGHRHRPRPEPHLPGRCPTRGSAGRRDNPLHGATRVHGTAHRHGTGSLEKTLSDAMSFELCWAW